jgi:hypothetical protein
MAIDTELEILQTLPEAETGNGHSGPDWHGTEVIAEADVGGGDSDGDSFGWRAAIAVALSSVSAAVVVGGVFVGASPRIYAALAGLLGIGLAVLCSRTRSTGTAVACILGGLFAIGIVLVIPFGPDHLGRLGSDLSEAINTGKILRPPAPWTAGWVTIVGWVSATAGFAAAWTAVVLRKPSIGVMLPLPLAIVGGISLPADQQVASGLVAVVLFGAALGVLASAQLAASDEGLPLKYELRRGARAVGFMGIVVVLLYAAAQSNILFPHPAYDPKKQPTKPTAQPLGQVVDKVLFEVTDTTINGPWVLGDLDVYDGTDWLLPPFGENQLSPVPKDGLVDASLPRGAKATFTVKGLSGAVLPGLPNVVGIVANGPSLSYDPRSGNIRLTEGQFNNGFTYSVAAAVVSAQDLTALGSNLNLPDDIKRFESIPKAPRAVADLIAQAPTTSKWEQYDFLRHWVLDNVTVEGPGTPVSITPDRAGEIVQRKSASPFEIVAMQAMLARWIGLPSRIGYGFDGGDHVNNKIEVHPRNGSAFPEVYFPNYKWVPVMGTPAHAKATENNDPKQQNVNVTPSDDIAVSLYVPEATPVTPSLFDSVKGLLLAIALLVAFAVVVYLTVPPLGKFVKRSRHRAAAAHRGARDEIAQAYAEWRDHAADFGYDFPGDTPLMFVDRFVPDETHSQLAWLVTRALWGDLQHALTPSHVEAAKVLSGTLRRRLSQARPITVRIVASFSRRSLTHPYVADTGARPAGRRWRRFA